jgi:fatty acid amide hydrolase
MTSVSSARVSEIDEQNAAKLKVTITDLTASELARRIRSGELSSLEVTEAFIQRIKTVDQTLNAVVVPLFEEALIQAAAADRAQELGEPLGPLHGVPVTIKEQYSVGGTPVTLGLPDWADKVLQYEGPLVSKLRQAGAIILGKTNVPQLLVAHETDNPLYGRTNNPWDLERTPGGSSGGEGAIIAARGSPIGLGGDFGGSIRVPSHFSGIIGLKPTAGRLEMSDVPPDLYPTGQEAVLYQPGPMARSVEDLRLVMEVLVEERASDEPWLVPPVPWHDPEDVDVSDLRIAMYTKDGYFKPSPPLRRAVEEVAEAMRLRGATVEPFEPPDVHEAMRLFLGLISADGGISYKRALGGKRPHPLIKGIIKGGTLPSSLRSLVTGIIDRKGQHQMAFLIKSMGRRSTEDYWHLTAERSLYRQRFLKALDLGGFDAIICPPFGLVALRHGASVDLFAAASYAVLYNTLGLPAGVVPVTRVQEGEESDRPPSRDASETTAATVEKGSAGLPVGVQVVGRYWREDVVLAIMAAIEDDFRGTARYPDHPIGFE